jgi:hypothetical protein
MQISPQEYVLVLMVGAALLALWVVVRFPKLTPATLWLAGLHAVAALALGRVAVHFAPGLFGGLPLPNGLVVAAVFGILPPATYICVSLAWLIQNFQRLIARPF